MNFIEAKKLIKQGKIIKIKNTNHVLCEYSVQHVERDWNDYNTFRLLSDHNTKLVCVFKEEDMEVVE